MQASFQQRGFTVTILEGKGSCVKTPLGRRHWLQVFSRGGFTPGCMKGHKGFPFQRGFTVTILEGKGNCVKTPLGR
jgi:hypothetical protein